MKLTPSRLANLTSLFIALALLFSGCRKGEIRGNGIPDTKLSVDEINLTGEDRLNSSVRLSWYGTDQDGFIEGYELSLDNQNWTFTTLQDSVFLFDIPVGQDTADIDFYVRAIDNDGNVDPTPAYLQVPLINTPPNATLLDDRGPGDTAYIAATFFWNATDPDGNSTLKEVQLKINNGNWVTIDQSQNLISFLPDTGITSGAATSQIYYGTSSSPASLTIDGLRMNDTNRLYIRALDIADAISEVDTSAVFYLKGKTPGVQTLWISGHNAQITSEYRSFLNNSGIQYDLLNCGSQQGATIPKYFNPTVQLIFKQYNKAFLNLSSTSYTSPVTGESNTLLGFLAPVIQRFVDRSANPGKYFITTSFNKSDDVSELVSVYPFSSLAVSTVPASQARIPSDSSLVPLVPGNYPHLQPTNVEFGVVPIVASSDATDFYRAELQKFRGWNGGSDIVATLRRPQNQLTQVFFALELHKYDKDPLAVEQLIGDIFKNEF